MPPEPTLLYVTPVMPAPTGNGLAMRAHAVLAALARRFAVSLLVAARYPSPFAGEDGGDGARAAGALRVRTAADGDAGAAAAAFAGERFDVVHVFRLAAVDAARTYLDAARDAGAACWLDLDESESAVQRRLAALHRLRDEPFAAEAAEAAAVALEAAERAITERVDRIYVSSEAERARLVAHHAGGVEVVALPNILPVPVDALPPAGDDGPFRLAFVGSLGYLPNEDGVTWFVDEVLPRLRGRLARPVELVVAGTGAPAAVRALAGRPGVSLLGPVADVAAVYRSAHVAIVPLRAGGGTRIKALEAFAFARPVVTTTLGVEGLAVADRVHVLVADDPDAFAARCAELAGHPERARALAAAGRSLLIRRHGPEALDRVLDASLSAASAAWASRPASR